MTTLKALPAGCCCLSSPTLLTYFARLDVCPMEGRESQNTQQDMVERTGTRLLVLLF
jgi:hypothetical protein